MAKRWRNPGMKALDEKEGRNPPDETREGEQLRDEGMAAAELNNEEWLVRVRAAVERAARLGLDHRLEVGESTVCAARDYCIENNDWPESEAAWGTIFYAGKNSIWENTGRRIKSRHKDNNARKITIWRLKGTGRCLNT